MNLGDLGRKLCTEDGETQVPFSKKGKSFEVVRNGLLKNTDPFVVKPLCPSGTELSLFPMRKNHRSNCLPS